VEVTTTCGPVREENQDAALVWRADSGTVAAVVSDGMGGHADGRRAAEIVVRTSIEVVRERAGEPWGEVLGKALGEAHARVLREAGGDGMGATAVAAVLDGGASPPRLYLAHVGDSRAYLCRGNSIYRLTEDHSQVGRLVRDGYLTEEEAFGHPDSNVILRAIGQEALLEPELHDPVPIDPGDWILLCSDGLHGAVPDREILAGVRRSHSAAEACRTLLQLALDSHSQDNVTILCIHPPEATRSRRPTRPG
jgi:protein phosphatase